MRAAVDQGFGYIEVDVRASADGKVVVFLDERLDRISTAAGKLSDHTWDELSTLTSIGLAPRHEDIAGPLMIFEQLLEIFSGVRFIVDLKDRQSAAPMVEILRCYSAWDRVLIASFQDSHRALFFNHLRKRLKQHVNGNASHSTLRRIFGVLLMEPLGLSVGIRKDREVWVQESVLTDWMYENARVAYAIDPAPWIAGGQLLEHATLALNIQGRQNDEFARSISARRSVARKTARSRWSGRTLPP